MVVVKHARGCTELPVVSTQVLEYKFKSPGLLFYDSKLFLNISHKETKIHIPF